MKANINKTNYLDDELSLAEPHFDDEETLLTARPVVPLKKVKANQTRGRGRAFGLAIATSLLVGFLGATAVYRIRSQKSPGEVINASVPGATGGTTDEPNADADQAAESGVGTTPAVPAATTKTPETNKTAAVLKPNAVTVKKTTLKKRQPAEQTAMDEYPESSGDYRREARWRWEERQEGRREARRELWRRERDRRNNAARIREIFEGSPRP